MIAETKTKLAIETIDYDRQVLTLKKGKANGPLPDRFSLIPDEIFDERAILKSIEQTVRHYLASGELTPALEDFFYRRRPRIHGSTAGPLISQAKMSWLAPNELYSD